MSIADPQKLLKWYDANARHLPWRAPQGIKPNPYHVWLSEIMLQQTTVVTVKPYFEKFLQTWPTIHDLAVAPLDDVLANWAGLGYYARARNLHKCANVIVQDFDGVFPSDALILKSLPGIGDYTSKAIASIAFEQNEIALDGNVERVLTRLYAEQKPIRDNKKRLASLAKQIKSTERFGDYQQALMDLGATICTPTKPSCLICPWQDSCQAYQLNLAEALPTKPIKKKRPIKYTNAFITIKDNHVFLVKRPDKGLLAGMLGIPTSDWVGEKIMPSDENLDKIQGTVRHVFTHFELIVTCYRVDSISGDMPSGQFYPLSNIESLALPTLMRKIITHSLKDA